jgi:predicted PurR-regulated permease PerM
MILLGIAGIIVAMIIVTVCRALARSIRDVNRWDRRSGR